MNEDPTFVLVCEGCGHTERDPKTERLELVDYKEHECGILGNAELLKRIHESKVPTHNPYIRTETEHDTHVPDDTVRSEVPLA